MIKDKIRALLKDVLEKDFLISDINFSVEEPENESFGDYSSNVALVASKILKKNPFELASNLAEKINSLRSALANIEKVEAVKPGFINFWISKEYLRDRLKEINDRKNAYGEGESLKGKKIMVEFTDPNPFKEFHIGHLYSNTVGESVSRLLAAMGAEIRRANYQGDVGLHVAKTLYSIIKFNQSDFEKLEGKSIKEKIKFLGIRYADGADMYENDEEARKEIEELNKKIYAKDETIMPFYEKGRQWSLEYFETIYKRLGTKFDFYYFESEVGVEGLKLVKEYLKKGVFEESQGAVIFPGKKQGLHDRVFINSLGLPTYEAKDLGLAFRKYQDFKFDQSISVTGNEIIGYFKVVLAALERINAELALKIKHLPHGMVRLPTGKMSSRTGSILTGEWLLDEAKKLLKNKYPEMNDEVLEKVAVGSVKYALLKSSLGHDIEFNFEESVNIRGNSGAYLQYAFARTQSVLAKAKNKINKISFARSLLAKLDVEEVSLLRALNRFPEMIELAGQKFAPNILCNYLFNLAQKFNLFYQKYRILGAVSSGVNGKHPEGVAEHEGVVEQESFRLALTAGVGQVIKNGLSLLGIAAPEKM